MSHCLGVMCATCRVVIQPDTCPERDCPGGHGYTFVEPENITGHECTPEPDSPASDERTGDDD